MTDSVAIILDAGLLFATVRMYYDYYNNKK